MNQAAELAVLGLRRRDLLRQLEACDDEALGLMRKLRSSMSLRDIGLAYGISYQTVRSWFISGIKRREPAKDFS